MLQVENEDYYHYITQGALSGKSTKKCKGERANATRSPLYGLSPTLEGYREFLKTQGVVPRHRFCVVANLPEYATGMGGKVV